MEGRLKGAVVGSLIAETATLPADVVKVRLQLEACRRAPSARSVAFAMFRTEGPTSFFKGLTPALLRQTCYTSLSMVLYEPVLDALSSSDRGDEATYVTRLLAGGFSGALSITVFNWTEVIKTRLQGSHVRTSLTDTVVGIYANGGIRSFWSGWTPNVARVFVVNAAELGTYDEAKNRLQKLDAFEHSPTLSHVAASGVAGVVSATCSTPLDVLQTRLMYEAAGSTSDSILARVATIAKSEGVGGLYKGFTAIVARKVAWCTVFFVIYEKMRANRSED